MQDLHTHVVLGRFISMITTDWIAQITTDSVRDISRRTGISERTLHHQVSHDKISIENILRIATAYGHHPVTALIDWEFIDKKWGTAPDVRASLRMASEEELADEILRRMKIGAPDTIGELTVDELAARRGGRTPSPAHDGTVRDWDPTVGHAADSSPDEDALREEHGGGPVD